MFKTKNKKRNHARDKKRFIAKAVHRIKLCRIGYNEITKVSHLLIKEQVAEVFIKRDEDYNIASLFIKSIGMTKEYHDFTDLVRSKLPDLNIHTSNNQSKS